MKGGDESAIHPDLVVQVGSGIVHVEFVKDDSPDFDLRMVDYRLRLLRRDRHARVEQYVLALRDLQLPKSYEDVTGSLRCSWTVVRLGELDPAPLLRTPTTAALAALAAGDVERRRHTLVAAADVISATTTRDDRRDALLGAAATLASIVLPRPIIKEALEEAAMPVPVRDTPLGRELYDEGRQEGRQRAVVEMTVVLLEEKFGHDPRIPALALRLARLGDRDLVRLIAKAVDLDELDRP